MKNIEQFKRDYETLIDYSSDLGVDNRDLVLTTKIYHDLEHYLTTSFEWHLSYFDNDVQDHIISKLINKDVKHLDLVIESIKENEVKELLINVNKKDKRQDLEERFDSFFKDTKTIKTMFNDKNINPNIPFYFDDYDELISTTSPNEITKIINKGIENLKNGIIDFNEETSELVLQKFQELFSNKKQKER